jgi:hypothetical protein
LEVAAGLVHGCMHGIIGAGANFWISGSRCQIFLQFFKVVYLVHISSPDSGAADSIRKSMCFGPLTKEQELKNG